MIKYAANFLRDMKNYVTIYILLSLLQPLIAQNAQETLIHLDKSFYVTGENVWFKLYFPESWQKNNIAVNTQVINPTGELVDQFFILSEGESYISGYYSIPFDGSTGHYEIQFAASAGPQTSEQFIAAYLLPVYNDLENHATVIPREISTTSLNPVLSSEEFICNFFLSDPDISSRGEVFVNISITDKNGNPVEGHASVSVKDGQLAKPITGRPEIMTRSINLNILPGSLQSQIYTRGQLKNAIGDPLQINVLGGFVPVDQKIYYSKSNTNGDFLMNLPAFTGQKSIQFLGFQYEQPDIRSNLITPVLREEKQPVIYTNELLHYLDLSRLRKKIFQYYETTESKLESIDLNVETQELKPDASYSVKQYESFKDMKSFFGELLTPLRFKLEKDSTYIATLYNAKGGKRSNTILNGSPLFFIDGEATRNADFVARLPISAIETVDLYLDAPKLRSYFQAIGVSGVVRISTSIANLKLPWADAGNIHPIYGIQPAAEFPVLHPDTLTNKIHQPFLRPQLYWNPDLQFDQDGKTGFSFYQSDDTGDFEIKLVFQSIDGRRGVGTFHYKVDF